MLTDFNSWTWTGEVKVGESLKLAKEDAISSILPTPQFQIVKIKMLRLPGQPRFHFW